MSKQLHDAIIFSQDGYIYADDSNESQIGSQASSVNDGNFIQGVMNLFPGGLVKLNPQAGYPFRISNPLTNLYGVSLKGKTRTHTILQGIGAVSPILDFGSISNPAYNGSDIEHAGAVPDFTMEDLRITRNLNGASKTGTKGFRIRTSDDGALSTMRNVDFDGSEINVVLGDAANSCMAWGNQRFERCKFGAWNGRDKVGVLLSLAANNVFDTCHFQGYDGSGSAGLLSESSNFHDCDVFLTNSYFRSRSWELYGADADYNIRWDSGIVFRMEQCQLEDGHIANCAIRDGIDIKVTGSNFGGCGRTGVGLYVGNPQGGRDITSIRVVGNSMQYVGGIPIKVEKNSSAYCPTTVVIGKNNIRYSGDDNGGGVMLWDVVGYDVSHNTIVCDVAGSCGVHSGSSTIGISLGQIKHNIIEFLVASANNKGIRLRNGCNYNDVFRNTILKNGGQGIVNQGSNNNIEPGVEF